MKLSVLVKTYNHAPFIEQCLAGALSQEAAFDYEVILGDDCSTDGTREIVLAYARSHPDRIRLILPERNLGGGGVPLFRLLLDHARGEYVAPIDGDDYWSSPHKLQTQVHHLDRHPELSLSFHNALVVDGSGKTSLSNPGDQRRVSTLEHILEANFIAGPTPMVRRSAVADLPTGFEGFVFEDWPLYIWAARQGLIGYLDEVLAVYRVHPGGVWSRLTEREQTEQVLQFYSQLAPQLPDHQRRLAKHASEHRLLLAEIDERAGDLRASRAELHQVIQARGLLTTLRGRRALRLAALLYAPPVRDLALLLRRARSARARKVGEASGIPRLP